MWEDSSYCWVVLCKNSWFHLRKQLFNHHRIPLGEADAVTPLPPLDGPFRVRCDECGKEYLYTPSDVRKYEQELPEPFTPHPLFRFGDERRRSRRSFKTVDVLVRVVAGETLLFQEKASATSVSDHGALVTLSGDVQIGQTLYLKNPRNQIEVKGRIVRIEKRGKGLAHVGVDFSEPAPAEFWPTESRGAIRSAEAGMRTPSAE
jgi:hypothetical protein